MISILLQINLITFFVDVGPQFAEEIITASSVAGVVDYVINVNAHSVFVRETDE